MPCDYSKYPKNWKTKIRPDILERAKNCCEFCKVPNHKWIFRGTWIGREVYQFDDGAVFDYETGKHICHTYVGMLDNSKGMVKVVLTIAHLDHDTDHNEYSNLKALCQKCHNNHDKEFRKSNRKKNKGVLSLFE